MSKSLIVIPIDQQGMADYETDISKRDNLKEFDFPKNEVEFLFDKGIVDVLNDTFGIWIDEYEEAAFMDLSLRCFSMIPAKYE